MTSSQDLVTFVYGTRPEIIKLAPLIGLLKDRARLVNTGQHFDRSLSADIAGEMSLPEPDISLRMGGGTRAQQLGRGIMEIEKHLTKSSCVVVQGDTNSAAAGALAANALEIPVFHVEAGLRSYDRRMPEEHNRVLIDHLADLCWAPTEDNRRNLEREGIPDDRITVTGNSIVEALSGRRSVSADRAELLDRMGLSEHQFVLATIHRPENVDDAERLGAILKHLGALDLPVVLPVHPRTMAVVEQHAMQALLEPLMVIPPVGYSDFLSLMEASAVVISDSGGVQEEVSILKVPLIVLRRSTERPEVIGTFARITEDPAEMTRLAGEMIDSGQTLRTYLASLPSPFGDGEASARMLSSLSEFLRWA